MTLLGWIRSTLIDLHWWGCDAACAYRPCLMVRRPDTGWWFLFLDRQPGRVLSLRVWEWLP